MWYLNINRFCKAIPVDQNITCTGFKPQWVDAQVNNCLTIQARELKFYVCYIREKSAPLTNFSPIRPLQAMLVILIILFAGCHTSHTSAEKVTLSSAFYFEPFP